MDDDEEDDYERDDEAADRRDTSECDGLCDPMCAWCLAGHYCPEDCAGGPCPYDAISAKERTGP